MVILVQTLHQHIIHVNLDIPPNLVREHFVHQSLVRCPRVLESERHHLVAKKSLTSDKGYSLLILFVHFDLIITWKGIHEAQEPVSSRRVHQSIYPREGIAVFWERPIEIREINAHSPFSISLLDHDHDHIRQPVGVVYFSVETNF